MELKANTRLENLIQQLIFCEMSLLTPVVDVRCTKKETSIHGEMEFNFGS
jgi:hypothetical protein